MISVANSDVLQLKNQTPGKEHCDLFQGEWISNPADPPYSETCQFISDDLNCLENERPDRGYLHLRWKPYGCDLPLFNPEIFLNSMKDKSFAFIGDSLARNQKESLMCLLSKVEEPVLVYSDKLTPTMTWHYPSYNFTLAAIWSPLLLQPDSPVEPHSPTTPLQLHLDIPDRIWTDRYQEFDYVLIGVGAWFDHVSILYENNTIIGCHKCKMENVRELGVYYPFQRAIELAFRFVTSSEHKPFVIYRIHTPNHFEHGRFDQGGYCNRTLPFKEGEFAGDEQDQIIQDIAREEFAKAVGSGGGKNGVHLEMLDVYHLSLLRPDGHPDNYRGIGRDKHDCLHWCLPGPIDTWNDLMMQMVLRNENQTQSS